MGSVQIKAHDILIIGAGLSGICSLYHLRKRFPSWNIRVIEGADSVGGTWYWNRYPGARVDSESLSYAFSFDKELMNEWHWKESFAPQSEILRYIERIVEKHDLAKSIHFNTRVKSARWQDSTHTWLFTDESGKQYQTRFFVSCMGFLSSPILPAIPGIESFKGKAFHTSRWPRDFNLSRDFGNKRIGVIGTGATGIQTITAVSKEPSVKSLTVFQRTANWSAPLRNEPISLEQMQKHWENYDELFKLCNETPACFMHKADPRKSLEVSPEERLALWEEIYAKPGFAKWLGTFSDTYTSREANKLYSDFIADKIRARVNDPKVADILIPKTHGFGTRRVPLESGYFEVYNQPNVHLIDLQQTPIDQITETGIQTSDGKVHELDVLIYATGFDAITGAFSAIEWHAKDGRSLLGSSYSKDGERAVWIDHKPQTFLGITAHSMPNMFMVLGPHQPFGNAPRTIEHAVQVVSDLLQYCKDNGYSYVEPTQGAVEEWTEHVVECSKGHLANEIDSWMTGVNKNIKSKTVRSVARYSGHAVEYRRKSAECKAAGWKGLVFA
ncbi:putative dimethylaniline monooxygenase [Penicillium brasilianum]|uniref:Putative dimethylaniline monooxygenase n=1 Tax=Penicillium brasilianum TaxID=104259 RepID=A0A1S9RW11_PENBI|nr:putative dimethylaniline monooxygenase [Penicillium brasilianum]